jgi:phage gpG-like protein
MNPKDFLNEILKDVEIDLTQEFDRNFERKAFFNKKWPQVKHANSRGSLLMRTGRLRRSVKSGRTAGLIRWSSNLPYASIHNEGGEITVTSKMKSFFWAMFYKSSKAIGKKSKSKRAVKLSGEASKWKALALLKIGTKLKIEQRQFIGWHPEVDRRIKKVVNYNVQQLNKEILKQLK